MKPVVATSGRNKNNLLSIDQKMPMTKNKVNFYFAASLLTKII